MIPVKTALALWYAPMKTVVSLVVPEAPPRIILQDQTSGEREEEIVSQVSAAHDQVLVRRTAEGSQGSRTRFWHHPARSREARAMDARGRLHAV